MSAQERDDDDAVSSPTRPATPHKQRPVVSRSPSTPSKMDGPELRKLARRMKMLINKQRQELGNTKEELATTQQQRDQFQASAAVALEELAAAKADAETSKDELHREVVALQKQLAAVGSRAQEARTALEKSEARVSALEEEAGHRDSEIAELRTKLRVALRSVDELSTQLEASHNSHEPSSPLMLPGANQPEDSSMATHETTREALRGRLDILETELTEKKADLTAMQQSRVEMQSKMKRFKSLLHKMQAELSSLRTAKREEPPETQEQGDLQTVRAQLETMRHERNEALAALEAVRSAAPDGAAVDGTTPVHCGDSSAHHSLAIATSVLAKALASTLSVVAKDARLVAASLTKSAQGSASILRQATPDDDATGDPADADGVSMLAAKQAVRECQASARAKVRPAVAALRRVTSSVSQYLASSPPALSPVRFSPMSPASHGAGAVGFAFAPESPSTAAGAGLTSPPGSPSPPSSATAPTAAPPTPAPPSSPTTASADAATAAATTAATAATGAVELVRDALKTLRQETMSLRGMLVKSEVLKAVAECKAATAAACAPEASAGDSPGGVDGRTVLEATAAGAPDRELVALRQQHDIAQSKLEHVEQQMEAVQNQLTLEMETAVAEANTGRKQAEQQLEEARTALAELQAESNQVSTALKALETELQQANAALAQSRSEAGALQDALSAAQQQSAELDAQLVAMRAAHNDKLGATQSLLDEATSGWSLAKEELETIRKEMAQVTVQASTSAARANQFEKQVGEAHQLQADAETALASARDDLAALQAWKVGVEERSHDEDARTVAQLKEHQETLQQRTVERDAALQSLEVIQQRLECAESEVARLHGHVSSSQEEQGQRLRDTIVALIAGRVAAVHDTRRPLRAELAQVRGQCTELEEQLSAAHTRCEELDKRLVDARGEAQNCGGACQETLQQRTVERDAALQSLEVIQQRLECAESEVARLHGHVSSSQEEQGQRLRDTIVALIAGRVAAVHDTRRPLRAELAQVRRQCTELEEQLSAAQARASHAREAHSTDAHGVAEGSSCGVAPHTVQHPAADAQHAPAEDGAASPATTAPQSAPSDRVKSTADSSSGHNEGNEGSDGNDAQDGQGGQEQDGKHAGAGASQPDPASTKAVVDAKAAMLIRQLRAKVAQQADALKKLLPRYRAVQKRASTLSKQLEALQVSSERGRDVVNEENDKWQEKLNACESSLNSEKERRLATEEMLRNSAEALSNTKMELAEALEEVATARRNYQRLEEEQSQRESARREQSEQQTSRFKAEHAGLRHEADEWARKHDVLQQQLESMKVQLSQLQSSSGQAAAASQQVIQEMTSQFEQRQNAWDADRAGWASIQEESKQKLATAERRVAELEQQAKTAAELHQQLSIRERKLKALLSKQLRRVKQLEKVLATLVDEDHTEWCLVRRWDHDGSSDGSTEAELDTRCAWFSLRDVLAWTSAYRRSPSTPGGRSSGGAVEGGGSTSSPATLPASSNTATSMRLLSLESPVIVAAATTTSSSSPSSSSGGEGGRDNGDSEGGGSEGAARPNWMPPPLQAVVRDAIATVRATEQAVVGAATAQAAEAQEKLQAVSDKFRKYRARASAALKQATRASDSSKDEQLADQARYTTELEQVRTQLAAAEEQAQTHKQRALDLSLEVEVLSTKLDHATHGFDDELRAAKRDAAAAKAELASSQAAWEKNLRDGLAESSHVVHAETAKLQDRLASLQDKLHDQEQLTATQSQRADRLEALLHTNRLRCSRLQARLVAGGLLAETDLSFATPRSVMPGHGQEDDTPLATTPAAAHRGLMSPFPGSNRVLFPEGTVGVDDDHGDVGVVDHEAAAGESPPTTNSGQGATHTHQGSAAIPLEGIPEDEREDAIARQLASILSGNSRALPATGSNISSSGDGGGGVDGGGGGGVGGGGVGGLRLGSHLLDGGGVAPSHSQVRRGRGDGMMNGGGAEPIMGVASGAPTDETSVLQRVVGSAVVVSGVPGLETAQELRAQLQGAVNTLSVVRAELADSEAACSKHVEQIRVLKDTIRELELRAERERQLAGAPLGLPTPRDSGGAARTPAIDSVGMGSGGGVDGDTAADSPNVKIVPGDARVEEDAGGASTDGTSDVGGGGGGGVGAAGAGTGAGLAPGTSDAQADARDGGGTDASVNLQYLKNIVVKYMLTAEPSAQQRMVPAVATLLGFTESERTRVLHHIAEREGSVSELIGRAGSGLFSMFG